MAPEAIALLASVSFALFAVYGWLGLLYSTPLVGAIVSLLARTVTLGAAVALSGGIPEYKSAALTVFVALGTARVVIVSPSVATTPLFSLVISLVFLRGKEKVTGLTILGTVVVMAGTVAIALGK